MTINTDNITILMVVYQTHDAKKTSHDASCFMDFKSPIPTQDACVFNEHLPNKCCSQSELYTPEVSAPEKNRMLPGWWWQDSTVYHIGACAQF